MSSKNAKDIYETLIERHPLLLFKWLAGPYFSNRSKDKNEVDDNSKFLEEADKIVNTDKTLAKRYVQLARKIGMRYNVRLSHEQKYKFCKFCHAYIKPGVTSKNTIKNGFVNIKCLSCREVMRYPYKNFKQKKRKTPKNIKI